jgi:hypothetical protein
MAASASTSRPDRSGEGNTALKNNTGALDPPRKHRRERGGLSSLQCPGCFVRREAEEEGGQLIHCVAGSPPSRNARREGSKAHAKDNKATADDDAGTGLGPPTTSCGGGERGRDFRFRNWAPVQVNGGNHMLDGKEPSRGFVVLLGFVGLCLR